MQDVLVVTDIFGKTEVALTRPLQVTLFGVHITLGIPLPEQGKLLYLLHDRGAALAARFSTTTPGSKVDI
eukprot:7550114-Alexandrium_andersonii.AAC.1